MRSMVRVAAAQYPIEKLATWEAYQSKLEGWVAEAASEGAQILVFPEFGAMEQRHAAVGAAVGQQQGLGDAPGLLERRGGLQLGSILLAVADQDRHPIGAVVLGQVGVPVRAWSETSAPVKS